MKTSRVVNFREVMITVILSMICGVAYFGWGFLYNVMEAGLPGSSEIIYGLWFVASILTAYIVQKPGIAMLSEVAAAFVEMIFGGQWGLSTLVFGLIQGAAAELIFAGFRYRTFNMGTVILAGMASAAASVPIDYYQGYIGDLTTGMLVLKIALRLLSGALFAGVLGKIVGDLLAKTGVLNSYQLIRSKTDRKPSF
ncbi:ECF transporter S component [Tumebacillus sp. ITR2]|uniref:ECF transporter S component n=1 Tax=Tumebacillus amylolyticus TaxID=2801339 RepID=A0ABS1J918_9BACL|nr:ECF transporter S component [Tumebacillus amylolyticus]MBL0386770.1 ECF transporter S component [Tumebacillus amylolyticus]